MLSFLWIIPDEESHGQPLNKITVAAQNIRPMIKRSDVEFVSPERAATIPDLVLPPLIPMKLDTRSNKPPKNNNDDLFPTEGLSPAQLAVSERIKQVNLSIALELSDLIDFHID